MSVFSPFCVLPQFNCRMVNLVEIMANDPLDQPGYEGFEQIQVPAEYSPITQMRKEAARNMAESRATSRQFSINERVSTISRSRELESQLYMRT
jgi:hypothetical protein